MNYEQFAFIQAANIGDFRMQINIVAIEKQGFNFLKNESNAYLHPSVNKLDFESAFLFTGYFSRSYSGFHDFSEQSGRLEPYFFASGTCALAWLHTH
jgi:hypothetical protein